MSPKTVLVLAVLTLVASVAAVLAVVAEPGTGRVVLEGEPAFPVLREAPDSVHTILVRTGDGEVTLERQADGTWIAPTAYGYPAAEQRVRDLVVGLADMQLIEPKTSNPERFARLEVEDVRKEGSNARLVRLADAQGETLAAVLIGKTRNRLTGTEPGGTYIRRHGEQQSWLASGRIELPPPGVGWLDRHVVDVAAESVVRIEVLPPDGPAYTLVRDGDSWSMAEGPEGARLGETAEPEDLAGVLARLPFEEVRPADELDWPESVWQLRLVTDGGLEVVLRLADVEGAGWARLDAAARPEDAEEEVVARAKAIDVRTEAWAYRLPEDLVGRIRRPVEAWLEDGGSS